MDSKVKEVWRCCRRRPTHYLDVKGTRILFCEPCLKDEGKLKQATPIDDLMKERRGEQ